MLILRRDGVLWLNVPVRFAALVDRFTSAAFAYGALSIISPQPAAQREKAAAPGRGVSSLCEVNISSGASASVTEE